MTFFIIIVVFLFIFSFQEANCLILSCCPFRFSYTFSIGCTALWSVCCMLYVEWNSITKLYMKINLKFALSVNCINQTKQKQKQNENEKRWFQPALNIIYLFIFTYCENPTSAYACAWHVVCEFVYVSTGDTANV